MNVYDPTIAILSECFLNKILLYLLIEVMLSERETLYDCL